MNNKAIIYIVTILFFFCFSQDLFSQSKLENAEKELEQARKLLKSLDKKSTRTLTKYQVLKKQINLQEVLLDNIKIEIDTLNSKITKNIEKKNELKNEINRLKKEYEELILYAYKTRKSRDKTMFIFSAKTFNQAYKRFVYLQYLTEYLEETTNDLSIKNDSISIINERLLIQKEEKLSLKEKQTDELIRLNDSKKVLASILTNLKNRKQELIIEINRKKKIAASLRKSIKKNIASNKSTKKSKLSIKFEKNKGRLPFPIKGLITSSFGKHTHSVLKNVEINNDGIEIASLNGEKVKAVHSGVVSQVLKVPGAHNAIIIKHGQYYTVYSNMDAVYVNIGENVKRGEALGTPYSRILNFQIWYQNTKLNPQKWLK